MKTGSLCSGIEGIGLALGDRWGNPFTVASALENGFVDEDTPMSARRALVVECFRSWLTDGNWSDWWFQAGADRYRWIHEHLPELAGHDLACWCSLDGACHADVLLELANRGES